jgi:hypothetical protein
MVSVCRSLVVSRRPSECAGLFSAAAMVASMQHNIEVGLSSSACSLSDLTLPLTEWSALPSYTHLMHLDIGLFTADVLRP